MHGIKQIFNIFHKFRRTDLFKTSFGNGIATIIKLFTGLVSNKIVAIYLGPAGIALLAQFQNFVEITGYFANFGVNNGITKYIAEHQTDEKKTASYISTGFYITLFGTFLLSCVIFFGRFYFSDHLLQTRQYSYIFIILSLSMLLITLNTFVISVLNGYKEFKIIIIRNIVAALVSLAITVLLVIKWKLHGALIGVILSQIVVFFIVVGVIRRFSWFKLTVFLKNFHKSTVFNLSKFSIMSLSIVAFVFVQLQIRNYIINHISVVEAGHWQAIVRISDIYLMVITNTLILYYLPRLSEIKSKIVLRNEILKGYAFIMPLTIFSAACIFFVKGFVVRLLFSAEFLPMLPLFKFQLLGDVFKVASWMLSVTMMAKAMTYVYIITDLVFCVINYLLAVFFINTFGIIGATYAFAIHYFLYLCTLIFIFRKTLFIKAGKNKI